MAIVRVKNAMAGNVSKADGKAETLAIPKWLRDEVQARDQGVCRLCGRHEEYLAIHHIVFGGGAGPGMGGRRIHELDNLLSVGWMYQHDCHSLIHGDKGLWSPLAHEVIKRPGVTMLQLRRWQRRYPGSSR